MVINFLLALFILIFIFPNQIFSIRQEYSSKNYKYANQKQLNHLSRVLNKYKERNSKSKVSLDRGIIRSKNKYKEKNRQRFPSTKRRRKRNVPLLSKPIYKNFSDNPVRPHKGILFQPDGYGEVISPMAGKVVVKDYMDGYEKYIIVEHSNGYSTVYGNLEEIYVDEQQKVKKGVLLGTLVKHKGLYFQINHGKKPVDPKKLLRYK